MKLPQLLKKPNKLKAPLLIRRVSGHSMVPTLPPRTLVVGLRWIRRLKPGDVVIFEHDKKEKIKRVDVVREIDMYVIGDHVDASTDSRHFGWVPQDAVQAKIIWPKTKLVEKK